jgi:hypothetical protein
MLYDDGSEAGLNSEEAGLNSEEAGLNSEEAGRSPTLGEDCFLLRYAHTRFFVYA